MNGKTNSPLDVLAVMAEAADRVVASMHSTRDELLSGQILHAREVVSDLMDAAQELETNHPDAGLGLTLAEELRAYSAAVAELVAAIGPVMEWAEQIEDEESRHPRQNLRAVYAALAKFGGGA